LCSEQECFLILVCARSGDVGLGEPDFGNNSGSCGRGAKRHLIFIQSPSSLSIWNDDGTTFSASPCTDLSGRWQIVDPMAALKYGLTAISMERASNVSSIFDLTEDLLVSATAGEGALFCLPTGDCRLNLTASTRGNRSVQLHFPRAGITNDRVYRFAPFPDASANDLALGRYAGFGTRTLVMVRE